MYKGGLRLTVGYGGRVYRMTPRRTFQNERDLLIDWRRVEGMQARIAPSKNQLKNNLVLRRFPQTAPIVGGIFSGYGKN
jgi:hypothetical protein